MEQFVALLIGMVVGVAGWWFTQRFGLEISYRHRILEQNTNRWHDYVERFYMPLLTCYRFLGESFKDLYTAKSGGAVPSDDQVELAFIDLAQSESAVRYWQKKQGGFFMLRDNSAEKLVSKLLSQITKMLPPLEDRSELRKKTVSRELMVDFLPKIRSGGELHDNLQRFKVWLGTKSAKELETLAEYIEVFCALFGFEVDLGYKVWYGRTLPERNFIKWSAILTDALGKLKDEGRIDDQNQERLIETLGLATKGVRRRGKE